MLPNIHKILYATDLSVSARHALEYAAVLSDRFGAEVTVLHVLPDSLELISEQVGVDLAQVFHEEAEQWINPSDVDKAVDIMRRRLKDMANDGFTSPKAARIFAEGVIKVVSGDPADRIVAETQEGKHDLVVMGTHGQGGLMALVLGSVARETIHRVRVPVLVVPLPEDHPGRM
jgi:nucleotide-binding universal stress UspA family protein